MRTNYLTPYAAICGSQEVCNEILENLYPVDLLLAIEHIAAFQKSFIILGKI